MMKSTSLNILTVILFLIVLGSCMDKEDPDAAHKAEVKLIDDYLVSQGISDEVLYDQNTGIRFWFKSYGNGPPPHQGQDVNITYTRALFADPSQVVPVTTTDDIEDILPQGLQYALSSILEGTRVTVFMPSKYGYGASGTTGVPANAILMYDLRLTEVIKTSTEVQQFKVDTSAIRTFIKTKNIQDTVIHPSGIWYSIKTAGTGDYPTVYDLVSFKYKLKLLTAPDGIIQENTLTDNSIFGLIDGLKIGLPLMREGTVVTFYIPSGLGYGKNGTTGIPANANLIFEIELTNVP